MATTQLTRSRRDLWAALTILGAAVVGLLLGLVIGGGAKAIPLADPGAIVRWGLPVGQMLVNLSAALTIGGLLVAAGFVPAASKAFNRAMTIATVSAGVWTAAAVGVMFFTYLNLDPSAWGASDFGTRMAVFIRSIDVGKQWMWVIAITAVVTVWCAAVRSIKLIGVGLLLALAALVPLAFTGHGSSNPNHVTAVGALLVHIVAAAVWIGGLAVIAIVRKQLTREQLVAALNRYSVLALAAFIAVGGSGIVSVIAQTDLAKLVVSGYGLIVLFKAALFVAIGTCGAIYRTRAIPRLSSGGNVNKLLVVELLCMGAVSGLAAALGRSAPPSSDVALGTTPAEILTGQKLPPELTSTRLLTEWNIDPIWMAICVLGVIWYWSQYRKLRTRGDAWPIARPILWTAGLVLLFWITNGALNRYQEYLFSVHMTGHMLLSMFVPVLLAQAAPVTLLLRANKARKDGSWGIREWVLWAVNTPWGRFWANPVVAGANFAISLILFYYTPLFRWSVFNHLGHEWMTIHFLIVGYLLIQGLIGIDPGPKPSTYAFRIIILMATMAFHAFFGISLMMGSGLLLPDWYGAMGRSWGAPPLLDQQNGGGVAWGIGELPTVVIAVVLSIDWARSDRKLQKRIDRQAERDNFAELDAYNDMLEKMSKR